MRYLLFVMTIAFLLPSCGENEIEPTDPSVFGYEYFPVSVGNEWIYQVDSLLIGQGGFANVESSSQVKEVISEVISQSDDEIVYRVERSARPDSTSIWRLTDIWTVSTTPTQVTKTIENLKFIKLVFPAVQGARWDGNIFFDANSLYPVGAENLRIYQDWSYRIDIESSAVISGEIFDDVALVSHIDQETFVSRRYSTERYVKGIGLVERQMEIYDNSSGKADGITWEDGAEKGFRLLQRLISSSIQ